jgi:hypothetical protein
MAKPPPPLWRQAFDALEEPLRKRAEAMASTEEFGRVLMTAFTTWTSVSRTVRSTSTTLLHLANLPAHADFRRLARQVGALEAKLEKLAAELERLGDRLERETRPSDRRQSR